jgi:hypothetical protein
VIRGQLEFGNRQGTLRFNARFEKGPMEHHKLKTQNSGMAVMALTYDDDKSLELTWQNTVCATTELDATNGTLPAVAKSGVDRICQ